MSSFRRRHLLGATLLIALLVACEPKEDTLAVGEGFDAFSEGTDLVLWGADHERRDIDGKEFECAGGGMTCRRIFVARYKKDLERTAFFVQEHPVTDIAATLTARTAGGYLLVTTRERWLHGEEEDDLSPLFDIFFTELSAGLEKGKELAAASSGTDELHAGIALSSGELWVAGLRDGALFLRRHASMDDPEGESFSFSGGTGGRVVFLAGAAGMIHLVRWFPGVGFRYLAVNGDGTVRETLTVNGESLAADPRVGDRGIAARIVDDSLHWLGDDGGLYRFVGTPQPALETVSMLDLGALSGQRDFRVIGSTLYVYGTNDRVSNVEG
ncbi:MAG TPA: hypothetical protein P5077_12550, partial [bacterium]|nr:hypothetical protein [bacterium]